jgi:hypothetical protein
MNGQRHAPATLYHREKTFDTHSTGGWVGLRADLDTEVREKILRLSEDRTPEFQSAEIKK